MLGGLLQEMVGWLGVLVSLGGVVVCALHLGRSRWIVALLAGFGLETLVSAFYRVATFAMTRGGLAPAAVGAAFLLTSLVGLVARAAIVGGLAGVLSELVSARRAASAQV